MRFVDSSALDFVSNGMRFGYGSARQGLDIPNQRLQFVRFESELRHARAGKSIRDDFLDIRALIPVSQLAAQTRTAAACPGCSVAARAVLSEDRFPIGRSFRVKATRI